MKPWSTQPASKSSHFSGCRKDARSRSRLLCGIRSASRILFCMVGFAVGRFKRPNNTDAERERFAAMVTLIKFGWGADDPTFRQIFTSQLMPKATREHADAFKELQRKSASPECAVRYYETVNNFDVRPLLPRVAAPTLVMHVRNDAMVPVQLARELAAGIPGARFVALPTSGNAGPTARSMCRCRRD